MKVYGVAPDVVSYTMAMDACAKAASWETVCSIFLVGAACLIITLLFRGSAQKLLRLGAS